MRSRLILYAEEGMVLTDGEVFCTEVQLAEGNRGETFYEITKEEYQKRKDEETDVE